MTQKKHPIIASLLLSILFSAISLSVYSALRPVDSFHCTATQGTHHFHHEHKLPFTPEFITTEFIVTALLSMADSPYIFEVIEYSFYHFFYANIWLQYSALRAPPSI